MSAIRTRREPVAGLGAVAAGTPAQQQRRAHHRGGRGRRELRDTVGDVGPRPAHGEGHRPGAGHPDVAPRLPRAVAAPPAGHAGRPHPGREQAADGRLTQPAHGDTRGRQGLLGLHGAASQDLVHRVGATAAGGDRLGRPAGVEGEQAVTRGQRAQRTVGPGRGVGGHLGRRGQGEQPHAGQRDVLDLHQLGQQPDRYGRVVVEHAVEAEDQRQAPGRPGADGGEVAAAAATGHGDDRELADQCRQPAAAARGDDGAGRAPPTTRRPGRASVAAPARS